MKLMKRLSTKVSKSKINFAAAPFSDEAPVVNSKQGSSLRHLKIDPCTITSSMGPSFSTCRVAWSPMMAVTGQSAVKYDVRFLSKDGGKRYTFRTADNLPGIVLPKWIVHEKVGREFTVQIRLVNQELGEWSGKSEVLSLSGVVSKVPRFTHDPCTSRCTSTAKQRVFDLPSVGSMRRMTT